jgi:hypothetical protein
MTTQAHGTNALAMACSDGFQRWMWVGSKPSSRDVHRRSNRDPINQQQGSRDINTRRSPLLIPLAIRHHHWPLPAAHPPSHQIKRGDRHSDGLGRPKRMQKTDGLDRRWLGLGLELGLGPQPRNQSCQQVQPDIQNSTRSSGTECTRTSHCCHHRYLIAPLAINLHPGLSA